MSADTDFRKNERPPNSKAFAVDSNLIRGKSMEEAYQEYPMFKEAKIVHTNCLLYA